MKKITVGYNFGEREIYCAKMVAKEVKQDLWIGGKLIVIDNVPAGPTRNAFQKSSAQKQENI